MSDELTPEERKRQEHNSAVQHGGVTQIGDFDAEKQREEREERESELAPGEVGVWNEGDSALPTVSEEDRDSGDAEPDRDTDEDNTGSENPSGI